MSSSGTRRSPRATEPEVRRPRVGQPVPDLEVKIADLVPGDAPGKVQKFVLRDRLSAGVLPIESAQEVLS